MRLIPSERPFSGEVELPISKSIANRYLIINALSSTSPNPSFPGGELSSKSEIGEIHQLSPLQGGVPRSGVGVSLPEDVQILINALNSNSTEINIAMAGTAMRFLTAFYAIQEGKERLLSGDERMSKRPISDLIDALKELGADISYEGKEGYPPLRIKGNPITGGEVSISGSVSSQYISALMMIGPTMENGLSIKLTGSVLSKSYINLTAKCMANCDVQVAIENNVISIPTTKYQIPALQIEKDWSAASYFYGLACVKPDSKLLLKGLKLNSDQGDSIVAKWFEPLGVSSFQKEKGVEITSSGITDFPSSLDFKNNPDLAQTFAFLAAMLGKKLELTGLDNLRIKETDRVAALKIELEKLGVSVLVNGNALTVSGQISVQEAKVQTYNDHRMAMSAAILSTLIPTEIIDPEVVAKSFPNFWAALDV